MNFIADFFRSRQQEITLFKPPFNEDQVAALCTGEMPDGALQSR